MDGNRSEKGERTKEMMKGNEENCKGVTEGACIEEENASER